MKSRSPFSRCSLLSIFLALQYYARFTNAYMPLLDNFLRNISSGGLDLDPQKGALLSPLLTTRVPGTVGHAAVQQHFVNFFSTKLPKWKLERHNSTATTTAGVDVPISNLIFSREPPWTKPGQANFLTLAAHYDSKSIPEGLVGAMDGAVPCAILLHIARSIDGYMTQMHDEMASLGEGGTVQMDMGIQIVFLDGKESFDESEAALYGSKDLSKTWEKQLNPVGAQYPDALSQIRMFVLLDYLGAANPTIGSYNLHTHWAFTNIVNLEYRLRRMSLLETRPMSNSFTFETSDATNRATLAADYIPFKDRGVPFLHLCPSPAPPEPHTTNDTAENLDMPTVRDWAMIVTGFTLEWLDMNEVWPE